ncbi:MAG: NHL repeat-containing protein [Desulfobacteraceae bacterium]|nr:NHL repeat-containing protein [Desulfobacteraceae bacterium]
MQKKSTYKATYKTIKTPVFDGRLQVRIDLPEDIERAAVFNDFKIEIFERPVNNQSNSIYNTVCSTPFLLGNTLFLEAQVKKGFLYEVIVNLPQRIAEDQIKTYIIREISSEPFFFSLDKNISSLSFNLPDGLRFNKISDSMLLIEDASCALLNNTINLAPLSEQVIIQYDPFLHHVCLGFSEGLASWNILENSLSKNIPNTLSVIYEYKKQGNTIAIKHAGPLSPQVTVNGNYLNVKFLGAFVKLNNQVNFYEDEFIRAIIWEQDNQNVNLTVCCNQEIEPLKEKLLMQKDQEFSLHLQKRIVEKKVATKEKEKQTRLFYEPYIAWGKKGFEEEEMYNPGDVAIDKNGFVYVADTFNHQIKKFKLHYSLEKVFGRHGEQPGQFVKPCSIAVGPDDFIYVADMMNNRIQVFDSNGKFVKTWGSYGKEYGQLANPLAIDVDNNRIVYVADMNNRITSFTSDGKVIDVFGKGGVNIGEFSYPSALVYDNETGFLYIADTNNNRIQVLYKRETIKIFKIIEGLPDGLSSPSGIEIYGKNLYIADTGNNRLVVLDKTNGSLTGTCGKKGSSPGEFSGMQGIAALDNNLIFIIDRYNNRLQVLKRK